MLLDWFKPKPKPKNGSVDRLDETGNLTRIITSYNNAEDNINVVVRVRPLNVKEKKFNNGSVIQFPGNGQILLEGSGSNSGGQQKQKLFSFNVVFEPAATQADVLEYSGVKRLVEMAVQGFSCTCLCYGQTGSGKTHTLTGPPGLIETRLGRSEDHGLIVRSFNYLFHVIEKYPGTNFILKASFLEIYNEKVIDLLNPGTSRKPLTVRWSKKTRGFFVENLFVVECLEADDLVAVLEEGMRNRSVGRHQMNEHSSRSHTILTVHVVSEHPAEGTAHAPVFIGKHGKLHFVDLAGSEMTKKTLSEGKTLEEANNINKSLMVLGYCISSLSDAKKRSGHIPYRDSKLTKLLADSLAGNGVTLMIACVSPAKSNLSETVNTLRYAARAKKIRTKPIVVMDPREALILSLKREVSILKTENDRLRSVLHLHGQPATVPSPVLNGDASSGTGASTNSYRTASPPAAVDLERLAELQAPQLGELVKLYLRENEQLRKDNHDLFHTRDLVLRDQQLLSRENERLLKKLEDVNSIIKKTKNNGTTLITYEKVNAPSGTGTGTNSYRTASPPAAVDLERLAELQAPQLGELVKLYLRENEQLRKDNHDLFHTRDLVLRDQQLLSRENERLLKKLEDVNSVCCRSPIIPARPTLSAEMLNRTSNSEIDLNSTAIWEDNALSDKKNGRRLSVKLPDNMPDKIQRELDRRRIGNGETSHRPSHRTSTSKQDKRISSAEMNMDNGQQISPDSQNSARHGSVLPDRAELHGRPRLRTLTQSPLSADESAAISRNNTARVQDWLTDNRRLANPLDTSCLSPQSKHNHVFGTYVNDDDDVECSHVEPK